MSDTTNYSQADDICILGAGTWGAALGRLLTNAGKRVSVWTPLQSEADDLTRLGEHANLPGVRLPESIVYTTDMAAAVRDRQIIVMAVPSVYVRATAAQLSRYLKGGETVVSVAKGIEADTLMTLTQVIADEVKAEGVRLVALSGPTHAEEVARDMPTTIVAAAEDRAAAEYVKRTFECGCLRVYTNSDIVAVELMGALKNVIALAAGISDGLGYGDNAKAAIITRGLAELSRLGRKMGCRESTFYGLAGVGDLIVTCTSRHSRNNRAGRLIGEGRSVDEALREVGMVVEGIYALPAAVKLRDKYDVYMPIVSVVDAIVNGRADARAAAESLLSRQASDEIIGREQ